MRTREDFCYVVPFKPSPFVFIGKEIERRAQEGEDVSVLENAGPIKYHSHQTLKTRPCVPELVKKLNRFSLSQLEQSDLTRDTIIRARRGDRVHPSTCTRLAHTVQNLDREGEPPDQRWAGTR